jgi:hypothetical protein
VAIEDLQPVWAASTLESSGTRLRLSVYEEGGTVALRASQSTVRLDFRGICRIAVQEDAAPDFEVQEPPDALVMVLHMVVMLA